MMQSSFAERLSVAVAARGPLCVGIDPHPSLLAAWNLSDDPGGLEKFARTTVEALADRVAVLKPQSAFFERHGSRGVAVLETVISEGRAAGALVLVDAKRADIGSTMEAYADAYVDPASPLCGDAVTVVPYLGFESLRPVLDRAATHSRGVFVVALTSNPAGLEVQAARTADDRTVAGVMLDHVRRENSGSTPFGNVGCVVGATVGEHGEDLDVNGPLLAPGLGAQGGRPEDLRRVFGHAARFLLPSVSRQVLSAGPALESLRAVTAEVVQDCREALRI